MTLPCCGGANGYHFGDCHRPTDSDRRPEERRTELDRIRVALSETGDHREGPK